MTTLLYAFGFGRSDQYPTGLFTSEFGRRTTDELRAAFGAGCSDLRERSGFLDRDVSRNANGTIRGRVRVTSTGIQVRDPNEHGLAVWFLWHEVCAGLSLPIIRELLLASEIGNVADDSACDAPTLVARPRLAA